MGSSDFFVRTNDIEAGEMLRKLADLDKRSMGNEMAWIVRQEYARRFSRPNPLITIESALQAGETIRQEAKP